MLQLATASAMPSLARLAAAEANINIQLALLVLHALLWHVITTRAARRIAPWCRAQPWIERFRARAGSTLRRGYGIQFKDEDDMFALVMLVAAILCVHLTGGLLCVPALLAKRPSSLVVALAAHGSIAALAIERAEGCASAAPQTESVRLVHVVPGRLVHLERQRQSGV